MSRSLTSGSPAESRQAFPQRDRAVGWDVAQSIFITSAEGHSGKSTVALGVLDTLSRATPRVGVFRADRPLDRRARLRARDAARPRRRRPRRTTSASASTYDDVRHDPDAALARIVERYKAVEAQCDAVVIVGSDYTDVGSPAELAYNARIAANLGAPCCWCSAAGPGQGEQLGASSPRTPEQMGQIASLALAELAHGRASLFAVIANRADPDELDEIIASIERCWPRAPGGAVDGEVPVWALPEDRFLVAPSVRGILRSVAGHLVKGDPELLTREVLGRGRRGHVDGQRPSPADRERDRRHPRRPHRGAAGDAAGQHVGNVPLARRASC